MFEVVSHILDRSNSFQVQFIPNDTNTTASTKFYISLFSQGGIDMINWSRSKNQTSWLAVARQQFLAELYPNLPRILPQFRVNSRQFRLIFAFSNYEYTYMFSKMLGIAPH